MHESWPKLSQRNAKDRANSRETRVLGSEILLWASPIAINEEAHRIRNRLSKAFSNFETPDTRRSSAAAWGVDCVHLDMGERPAVG